MDDNNNNIIMQTLFISILFLNKSSIFQTMYSVEKINNISYMKTKKESFTNNKIQIEIIENSPDKMFVERSEQKMNKREARLFVHCIEWRGG